MLSNTGDCSGIICVQLLTLSKEVFSNGVSADSLLQPNKNESIRCIVNLGIHVNCKSTMATASGIVVVVVCVNQLPSYYLSVSLI